MSLIWICFNKLGFTLLTAAVSFRFRLIFQTVLPICPFSPTPQIAYSSHLCLWFGFYFTKSGLLYAVFYKTTCWQSPDCVRFQFQMITHLIFKPVAAKYVFQLAILLQILELNHFSSKHSNHRSIEIEMPDIYFHCYQWK